MSEIELCMTYIAEEKAREEKLKEEILNLKKQLNTCVSKQKRYQNHINRLLK